MHKGCSSSYLFYRSTKATLGTSNYTPYVLVETKPYYLRT